MAAGIPVVASDWDGYKDSIRHGIDGFLVPTRWATGSSACGFALGWQQHLEMLSFPLVSGALGQLVQLDMGSAFAHLATLFTNNKLCRSMGAQGRKRAKERFSNQVVMGQYANLFGELQARRRSESSSGQRAEIPITLNPTELFSQFASVRGSDNWESHTDSPIHPLVMNNRAALWQVVLSAVKPEQRSELQAELLRKHL